MEPTKAMRGPSGGQEGSKGAHVEPKRDPRESEKSAKVSPRALKELPGALRLQDGAPETPRRRWSQNVKANVDETSICMMYSEGSRTRTLRKPH